MDISITKKDVIWSYLAQFFNLATGLITLPLILKLLTSEEVGFNYILISINSIIALFDIGFSGQFSRYLVYIFSGAQSIRKEGVPSECGENINSHLLASTIITAKKIYLCISSVAGIFLITLGTWYAYSVTEGFTIINNAIWVWSVFCLSSFFNIYFLYFNTFLLGRGLVKESKQAQVFSRMSQIIITFLLLYLGCGLLAVVVSNLISPFIFRIIAYKKFYTPEIHSLLRNEKVEKNEIVEIFKILFHNAKKMGLIGILSSALGYASTLVIGKYMSLSDVGSYGLMVQLVGILSGVATIHFSTITPKLASLTVKQNNCEFKDLFGFSMFSFLCIFLVGFIGIVIVAKLLILLQFNTTLPVYSILITYCIYKFIEQVQSLYSQLFLIQNDMRFYASAVITGIASFLCLAISLHFGYGLKGVVISQILPLVLYSAWKWPIEATKVFSINTRVDIFTNPILKIKSKIYE